VITSKIIRAEINVPLELTYSYAEPVQGQFGDQVRYTLVDGRYFYADLAVANKVQALGIGPGQPFILLKRKDGKSVVWQILPSAGAATPAPATESHPQVHRNGAVGSYAQNSRNGHGELAVPVLPGINGNDVGGTPPGPAAANAPEHSDLAVLVREHSQMLMHVFAQLVPWAASEFHGTVKSEDVRALMTSAYINITKGGPVR
jgi:hypothetical protein